MVDPSLESIKSKALATIDHSSKKNSRRQPRRKRRKKNKNSTKDQTKEFDLTTNDQQLTEFVTPSIDNVVKDVDLDADLQKQFASVLERFVGKSGGTSKDVEEGQKDGKDSQEEHGEVNQQNDANNIDKQHIDHGKEEEEKMSRKKRKQKQRELIATLKNLAHNPDFVDPWDVTADDPVLLVHLKSVPNSVTVPDNWRQRRKYLQGKRGMQKQAFKLPAYIADTGVGELRDAQMERDEKKTLKQRQREKMRAKTGKGVEIDVGRLYDAFFKFQTKPRLTSHGDVYYELKELEVDSTTFVPGVISEELRAALGMSEKSPPPWLVNMQRYGPPPSYPGLKVPGVNCEIPRGASFGYHIGGWGKPPVNEFGRPIYGDVFGEGWGVAEKDKKFNLTRREKDWLWGEMHVEEELVSVRVEEEKEEEEDEKTEKNQKDKDIEAAERIAKDIASSGDGKGGSGRIGVPEGQLYRVLEQETVNVGRQEIMGSAHAYKMGQGDGQDMVEKETGKKPEEVGKKRGREEKKTDGRDTQKKQKEFKF